jgi:hypothetical protein
VYPNCGDVGEVVIRGPSVMLIAGCALAGQRSAEAALGALRH